MLYSYSNLICYILKNLVLPKNVSKNFEVFDHCASKKLFSLLAMATKKVQKLTILMGNFSTPENCLQKRNKKPCKYLPCLLDSVLRRRMNSNVVNRIIFVLPTSVHVFIINSSPEFQCQHLPEKLDHKMIKNGLKIGRKLIKKWSKTVLNWSKIGPKLS